MLVHEAHEHLEDHKLRFGESSDLEAVKLLRLYSEAVLKAMRYIKSPKGLERRLADFEQADASTLEAYLHPHIKGRRRQGYGR